MGLWVVLATELAVGPHLAGAVEAASAVIATRWSEAAGSTVRCAVLAAGFPGVLLAAELSVVVVVALPVDDADHTGRIILLVSAVVVMICAFLAIRLLVGFPQIGIARLSNCINWGMLRVDICNATR